MCSSELCRGDGNTLDGSCEFLLRLSELGLQLDGARLRSLCRSTVVERETLAVVGATQGGMQGFLCDLELEREIIGSRLRGGARCSEFRKNAVVGVRAQLFRRDPRFDIAQCVGRR